jgi:hypothetical protein
MIHAEARATLLHQAADDPNVSGRTLKRCLDLLSYLDIEELEVESITVDEWGAAIITFAVPELPQLAVHDDDITAYSADEDDAMARLLNAVTCTYEADEMAQDEAEDDEFDD